MTPEEEIYGVRETPPRDDGRRLVWLIASTALLVAIGYWGWLGSTVDSMQQDVATLKAQMSLLLHNEQRDRDLAER